jgi:hypothetical protein
VEVEIRGAIWDIQCESEIQILFQRQIENAHGIGFDAADITAKCGEKPRNPVRQGYISAEMAGHLRFD